MQFVLRHADRLRGDYAKKKTEQELRARMASSWEKQSVYQKKFENDVGRYNISGGNGRKGSSEGSTPSGEAGLLKGGTVTGLHY